MVLFIVFIFIILPILLIANQNEKQQKQKAQQTLQANQRTRPISGQPKASYSSASKSSGSSIVDRAKENARKYQDDRALREMEATHDHKEKERPTNVKAESASAKATHPKNADHVAALLTKEENSLFSDINDLIVMGYQPKLEFERDFVAEGMDMINRFIYQ